MAAKCTPHTQQQSSYDQQKRYCRQKSVELAEIVLDCPPPRAAVCSVRLNKWQKKTETAKTFAWFAHYVYRRIILYFKPGVCNKFSIKFGVTMLKEDVGFLNFCYRVSIPFESVFHTRITNNEYVSSFCLREIKNTTAIKFFRSIKEEVKINKPLSRWLIFFSQEWTCSAASQLESQKCQSIKNNPVLNFVTFL